MIVKMKKLTIVVRSEDMDSTLHELRNAGVLHIDYETPPLNEKITELEGKYADILKAIDALPAAESGRLKSRDPEELIYTTLNLIDERQVIQENLRKVKTDIVLWREWEDFDPDLIDDLEDKGVWVRLAMLAKKDAEAVPEGVIVEELFRKGNLLYCAVISRKETALPFDTLPLPETGPKEMRAELEQEEARLKEIDKKLRGLAAYKDVLFLHKKKLESLLEFNKAMAGTGRFQKLSYIKSYCPVYNVNLLEKLAAREKWALLVEEPDEKDNAPTLIKNPAWIDIIRPVFNILKIVPGYREIDISPAFLTFFCLFFGMLIGDVGYGLVYILSGIFIQRKMKNPKDKKVFSLVYLLSSCAVAWGLITGNFFGPHNWLKPLIPYFSKDVNTQSFCFLIGATQLSIAHIWKFLRKWPSLKAISNIGWVLILWTAYFLANTLILGKAFPVFGKNLFIIGAALVILFTNPARNIFKGIGLGLGDFLLKLMNTFGDIVSYIRLFAVGAATVAIAASFNQIAASIGAGTVLKSLACFVILFLGHGLNIVMGILAVLVHGVRLNVLEFSGHLDIEWSGTEYTPFREI